MKNDPLLMALHGMRKRGRAGAGESSPSASPSVAIVIGDEGARQPNSERTEVATTMPNELQEGQRPPSPYGASEDGTGSVEADAGCALCGDLEHATEDHERMME